MEPSNLAALVVVFVTGFAVAADYADRLRPLKLYAFRALLAIFALWPPNASASTFEGFLADPKVANRAEKSGSGRHRLNRWGEARFGVLIHWDQSCVAAREINWCKLYHDEIGEILKPNPRPAPGSMGSSEWNEPSLDWLHPPVPPEVCDDLPKSLYPGMSDADEIGAQAMAAGIRFGINEPHRDWHHPDCRPKGMAYLTESLRNQIKELLECHPDSSIFRFDSGDDPHGLWEGAMRHRMMRQLRPDLIKSERWGLPGDYRNPGQQIGNLKLERDSGSNLIFTGYGSWQGYPTRVTFFDEGLARLVRCVWGNGDLLTINGPIAAGDTGTRAADRVRCTGKWLRAGGEANCGTTGGPNKAPNYRLSNRRGACLRTSNSISFRDKIPT